MNMKVFLILILSLGMPMAVLADTVVVLPGDMATSPVDVFAEPTSWFFYNDESDVIDNSLGSFVTGPADPLGDGSVEITVSGTERRNLATYQFSGVALADITELGFSTYNTAAGNGGGADRSAYLNFNVDFDGSDTWQRRLFFVPRDNGAVVQDAWQEWDAINGGTALWGWSHFANNGNMWPDGNTDALRTWDDLVSSFPDIAVRTTDSWLGLRVGEPYASGYTENLDAFVFGTAAGVTTFDFELVEPDTDGDGVLDSADLCADTSADVDVPNRNLGTNRWIYNGEEWETKTPGKKNSDSPEPGFTLEATQGCNCEQILDTVSAATEGDFGGHYKFGCSKSILEDFSRDYEDGVIDGQLFVENVVVPSEDEDGVDTLVVLSSEDEYQLTATGVADAGATIDFDALCSLTNSVGNDSYTDSVTLYEIYGEELLDLYVDGDSTLWGSTCAEDHTYVGLVTGTDAPMNFLVNDIHYPSNSGDLMVEIVIPLY